LGSYEWPSAIDVWKATYTRADGTWCIPNGEEIMVSKKIFNFYVSLLLLGVILL